LALELTAPAGHVELLVRGDKGEILADTAVAFAGEPAGTVLPVSWAQAPGHVLTIDLKVFSEEGAWIGRQYIPWRVDYTVAGIQFATGSAVIPESDLPVISAFYDQIAETATRVSKWVAVELYIGGFIPTNATREHDDCFSNVNSSLSEQCKGDYVWTTLPPGAPAGASGARTTRSPLAGSVSSSPPPGCSATARR
jgi:hypothetical protein